MEEQITSQQSYMAYGSEKEGKYEGHSLNS